MSPVIATPTVRGGADFVRPEQATLPGVGPIWQSRLAATKNVRPPSAKAYDVNRAAFTDEY